MLNTNKGSAGFLHPPIPKHRVKSLYYLPAIVIGLAGLISGCANKPSSHAASQAQPHRVVKVTAVGYGSSSAHDGYTSGQKRLMAMRASKLDAYRAMAEQVQGVRVSGNSTVAAMMAQVDSYRVYVDAYLRGVQVVTVTPMEDGNYETTMELTLNDQFFNTFEQPAVVSSNIRGSAGPGYAYGNNFYYSE